MNERTLLLNAERTQIATRLLELDVEEAENNRLYYCENKPTSMKVRSTLTAERTRLRLRQHQISLELARLRTVGEVEG